MRKYQNITSSKISKQEVYESDQKGDEEITNKLTKFEEIVEDKALEENDQKMLVEVKDESSERKNNNKLTKPLDKSTKEIVNVDNCSRAVIGVKEDEDNVFSLYSEFMDYSNIHGIGYHHKNRNSNEKDQDCKGRLGSIKDEKESRISFKGKEHKLLIYAQKSVNISNAYRINKVGHCYSNGMRTEKDEHQ
ncbi:hypothetical protein C2G38_2195528 [Gigaspora rosea]|uniref:Uncharacterized protein n=1 Tax=Gigaspora rosea TaxID=44941 RepID=A0A397UYQ5_9GLOM|nr:hypothetical protein C2G38_2195528 [Gigaspora rosea]